MRRKRPSRPYVNIVCRLAESEILGNSDVLEAIMATPPGAIASEKILSFADR